MMSINKYFLVFIFIVASVCELFSQTLPWIAPAGWSAKKSTIASSISSIQAGKNIYRTNCVLCHGEKGKGNGTLAMNLNPRPADHTSKKFQQQKDGEIFYKITTGRNAMPSFRQLFSDNDIWNIITYIRTLEVKEKPSAPKPVVTAVVSSSSTVTVTAKSEQSVNLPKDSSLVKQDKPSAKKLDTILVHQETIPQINIPKSNIADTVPVISIVATDSSNQNNQSEDSKEGRRKFLFTGCANIDVDIDGNKFNSAGIALGFMPIILWKPSKNLLFESHFHIMAGSGTPLTNTSSSSGGSMAGMIMRSANPASVQHSTTTTASTSTASSSSTSTASIMLAYADLVYFINPYVTLTGGMFLSPFGLYPERLHTPWMNRLPDAPAGMGNDQVLPETELGVQLRGGIPIGKIKVLYAMYVSNGPSLVDDSSKNAGRLSYDNLVDNNKNKALGGRIGFLPLPNNRSLEIGFFGQRARVGQDLVPHAGVMAMLSGADISFHHYFGFIKGAVDLKGQYSAVSVDKVYYRSNPGEILNVPAEDVNLQDSTYRFNNVTKLYYMMISYRPTASNNFLKNTEYVFRYDILKEPSFSRWNNSGSRFTMGLIYWLESRSAMKLAYQVGISDNVFTKNQNMLMLQWVIGF